MAGAHSGEMDAWAALVDLAVGRNCLACGRVGPAWCEECVRAVLAVHQCRTPESRRVVAAAHYGGVVRTAIIDHKEHGHLALANPLGRLLAATFAWGRQDLPVATLVAIPSTKSASRSRGHDHALRLARAAGAVSGLPAKPVLRWHRHVHDQAGLSAAHRRQNVSGAMVAARPNDHGGSAWLVDDVMTTGATLDEGARSLEAAGWRLLGVSVVAAVEAEGPFARRRHLR